jgi:hypothetical protein
MSRKRDILHGSTRIWKDYLEHFLTMAKSPFYEIKEITNKHSGGIGIVC